MIIYPAIDLRDGNCVRLFRGRFNEETHYSNNPIEVAQHYVNSGAKCLHIVDLDGAKEGYSVQHELIFEMQRKTHLQVQVGGGVRTEAVIEKFFSHGISRVILGSIAVNKPKIVKKWLDKYGAEKIVLAFDVKINKQGEPIVVTEGWEILSHKTLWNLLDEYVPNVKHILCTDVTRDGTLQGPNQWLYEACCLRYPNLNFQASGGVQSLENLKALAQIPVAGVIVGKALYEKKFSLQEAIYEVDKC